MLKPVSITLVLLLVSCGDLVTNPENTERCEKHSSFTFTALEDLPTALASAKKKNKKCLIYFTAYADVNSRKIEDGILIDPEIQELITRNCVCFSAYVDQRKKAEDSRTTIGEKHFLLEKEKFNAQTQPMFFILNTEGKILSEIGYTEDRNEFITFLKTGISQ